MDKNLCIIPARAGSKRIPSKNIRPFFGKPVIHYAIETALKSKLFDEVMVSTEDETIKRTALEGGATVPFLRTAETANDTASTVEVLLEVLGNYEKEGRSFSYGCCLYPVTPLTTVEQLQAGFEMLLAKHYDTVFPVVPFSFPIWRSVKRNGKKVAWNWPEYANIRSQDLPVAYHDAGQWYWFKTDVLQTKGVLLTDNTGSIVLDEQLVQDVDNESDWQMMKIKWQIQDEVRDSNSHKE